MDKRTVRTIINGFGAIPLLWIGVLCLFTSLCWIELGHFPVPSLNDPKGLGYAPLYFISLFGVLPVVVIIPAWILLLPLTIKRKLLTKRGVIIMTVGSTLSLIQLFVDPFDLFEWLLD